MKITTPNHYHKFHCIASACPDSCCKEWAVQVDARAAELYRALADIKSKELQQQQTLDKLDALCETVTLDEADIADVIEIWTGIPASTVHADEFKRLDGLEARLLEKIVGQDKAVSAIVRAVKRKRAGVSYTHTPVSFIFAGPTGVGKTELVKVLAEDLFQQPESLIRLDMSEYMEKHAVSRIIGAPPGYVGFDDAGQLTEKVRRRPYSVILLDEIEKAIHYFNDNYNKQIIIEDYAEQHLMSPCWFIQNFKQLTKTTPMQYIVSLRITNAMNMLENKNYNISQIAAAVGYDNPLYFSRLFKKHVGLSPSEYRDSLRQ